MYGFANTLPAVRAVLEEDVKPLQDNALIMMAMKSSMTKLEKFVEPKVLGLCSAMGRAVNIRN
jgi:hypothetical protein